MRVLHLTDLHLSPKNTRAFNNWQSDGPHLNEIFDFIVISGDLANKGKAPEYQMVAAFLDLVAKRVKDRDHARVIIVPGNHDVDHGAEIGTTRDPATLSEEDRFEMELPPELSRARLQPDPAAGGSRLLWIDDALYGQRFESLNSVLQSFYDTQATECPHSFFNLKDATEGSHFSAHLFPDDGVVFYGVNSCHRNDAFWRGASISREAVEGIRLHAQKRARDLIRIAIWHHGLSGSRGDSDFITSKELSDLATTGMTLGIHGHTHSDEQRNLEDVLRRRFPVVSTGSFGADQASRPPGLSNQMSILTIDRNRVKCRVYDLDESHNIWDERSTLVSPVDWPEPLASRVPIAPDMVRHTRNVTVDQDGIATVRVLIEGVAIEGPLVLASPMRGFDNIDSSEQVNAVRRSTTGVAVRDNAPVDAKGTNRFLAPATFNDETFETIEWAYHFSNGFALDGLDIKLGHARGQQLLTLAPNEDAYVYLVEAHTQHLELNLKLGDKAAIESAAPIAQRPVGHHPVAHWENDVDEIRYARLAEVTYPTNRLSLTVRSPRIGYRYGFSYALGAPRPALDDDGQVCLGHILKQCRRETSFRGDLVSKFKLAIARALGLSLGVKSVPEFWMVHLWSAEERRLLPAFGNFAPESWSSTFEYGSGVAGHAFRIRGPAIYYALDAPDDDRARNRKSRLIYREGRPSGNHRWIIELPILLSRSRPHITVGVIGFADQGATSGRDEKLAQLAYEAAWGGKRPELLNEIARGVSHAFWQTADKQDLAYAANIYETRWKKRTR